MKSFIHRYCQMLKLSIERSVNLWMTAYSFDNMPKIRIERSVNDGTQLNLGIGKTQCNFDIRRCRDVRVIVFRCRFMAMLGRIKRCYEHLEYWRKESPWYSYRLSNSRALRTDNLFLAWLRCVSPRSSDVVLLGDALRETRSW